MPNILPRSVNFYLTSLWVRVCGLLFEYLNTNVGAIVARLFEGNTYIEPINHTPSNSYLRLRVRVNLEQPLRPRFFLAGKDNSHIWVQLRYEEIFKYCIRCGRVGHMKDRCNRYISEVNGDLDRLMRKSSDRGFLIARARSTYTAPCLVMILG